MSCSFQSGTRPSRRRSRVLCGRHLPAGPICVPVFLDFKKNVRCRFLVDPSVYFALLAPAQLPERRSTLGPKKAVHFKKLSWLKPGAPKEPCLGDVLWWFAIPQALQYRETEKSLNLL